MSRAAAIALCAVTLAGCGGSQTFANPVYNGNFPDPFVLKDGDTYYAYATNGGGKQVQTLASKVVHWKGGPDALTRLGRGKAGGRESSLDGRDFSYGHVSSGAEHKRIVDQIPADVARC